MAPTTPRQQEVCAKICLNVPAKRGICTKICSITPQKTVVYAKILTVCEIYPNNLQKLLFLQKISTACKNGCLCKNFDDPAKTVVYAKISTAFAGDL